MVVYIPNQWFISIVLRSDGYNSYLVHLIYIYIIYIYLSHKIEHWADRKTPKGALLQIRFALALCTKHAFTNTALIASLPLNT